MNRAALLMQLARMAARGAGKMPKRGPSYTKHKSQQYLESDMPPRRQGVGLPTSPSAPIQQTTSPYTDRTRQSAYNQRGKLGRALLDAGERAHKRLGKGLYKPPKRIEPDPDLPAADMIKKLMQKFGGRAAKVEGLAAADRYKDIVDPDRQIEEQERLEEFISSLTPEELEEFERESREKPSLFDALTGPLGLGGSR